MKRMSSRDGTDQTGIAINPLVNGSSAGGVSAAYLESYKNARESGRFDEAPSRGRGVGTLRNVSTKTLIFIFALLLGGAIMLITGLVFFFAPTTEDSAEQTRGMDLLIASAICLLPGIWAAVSLCRGDYHAVSLG